ncbi:MAG: Replicative helicase [Bacteroidota bacterium]|jgi:replicative DNA helicase
MEVNESGKIVTPAEVIGRLRKNSSNASSSSAAFTAQQYGKLPPQAIELEEAVLGALMLEKDALTEVIDILHPDSFYKESHAKIYQAIQRLFTASKPIDVLTVTQDLRQAGELELAGGAFYLTTLTTKVASAANVEYHARIILQKHIQRELIRISSETIKEAYEETTDVLQLLDKAEKNLFDVSQGNVKRNFSEMGALVKEAIVQIEVAKTHKGGITGVESGFSALDTVTNGWQKSDLIILAARPAMGKTAFVLSLARNAAVDFNKPVAFFSLEMSSVQLVNRLISAETELSADKLRKGNLADHEWAQLNSMIGKLSTAPLYIDDTPAISIFDLRSKCRRLKQKHGIELIIIDYLQLMRGDSERGGGNREQEISSISRNLKAIAKELNVPIIALSQLSRAVETRAGNSKKPMLSDLRESGAIEQDADIVTFIYRPEYYGLDVDEEGNNCQGLAEIILAKHRNGQVGSVKLKFTSSLAKFSDWETYGSVTAAAVGGSVADYPKNNKIVSSRMNEMGDEPF